MKTYISTINEPDMYRKILNSADKTVTLILLYDDDNDSISLSVFESFSTAKCKVQFEKVLNSDIGYAYGFGGLVTLYPDVSLLSNKEVLKALVGLSSGTSKKRRPTRQKQDEKPIVTSQKPSEPKKTVQKPIEKAAKQPVMEQKVEKESFTREISMPDPKRSVIPAPKPVFTKKNKIDDDIFEQEYQKLEQFLNGFTTKEFNLQSYMTSIVSTAKTADKEGIAFSEAAEICLSPAVSKKVLIAIPEEKRAALVTLVAGMHDTI